MSNWKCPYCGDEKEKKSQEHIISNSVIDLYPTSNCSIDFSRSAKKQGYVLSYPSDSTVSVGINCNKSTSYIDSYMHKLLDSHIKINDNTICFSNCKDYTLLQKILTKYTWNILISSPKLQKQFSSTHHFIEQRLQWILQEEKDTSDDQIDIFVGKYGSPRFPLSRDMDFDILSSLKVRLYGSSQENNITLPMGAIFKFGDLSFIINFNFNGENINDDIDIIEKEYGYTYINPNDSLISLKDCYLPPAPSCFSIVPTTEFGQLMSNKEMSMFLTSYLKSCGIDVNRADITTILTCIDTIVNKPADSYLSTME